MSSHNISTDDGYQVLLGMRNWLVGAWIVEFEQNGKDRANYGAKLLKTLAADFKA